MEVGFKCGRRSQMLSIIEVKLMFQYGSGSYDIKYRSRSYMILNMEVGLIYHQIKMWVLCTTKYKGGSYMTSDSEVYGSHVTQNIEVVLI